MFNSASKNIFQTPLYKACAENNIEEVKKLLNIKTGFFDNNVGEISTEKTSGDFWDKNANKWVKNKIETCTTSSLYLVVKNKNVKLVELLLNDPTIDIHIGYHYKKLHGNNYVAETKKETPFEFAEKNKLSEIVKLFKEIKGDILAQDSLSKIKSKL
jgi:ankyrin repeat protein